MAATYPPILKRLGQHFLVDPNAVQQIADALVIQPGETVVEIGPGRGVLTDVLADRASKLVAVELDRALAELLRKRYAHNKRVDIVEADVLSVPLAELGGEGYALVGNVPYYITTPILFHALQPPLPSRAVFLVQQEVAERALADAGTKVYGALSVNLQVIARVETVSYVPATAFRPPPKVESAVMRVTPLAEPLVDALHLRAFQSFVQSVFALRRKQMVRVLRTVLATDADEVNTMLSTLGIDPAARPETLSPRQFAQLFTAVRSRRPSPSPLFPD